MKFLTLALRLSNLVRFSLFVLLKPVWLTLPRTRERLLFEGQNLVDPSCIRFNKPADYAFEVSSEGELEQVMYLIESLLADGKRIELIYSSPSVNDKCHKLYRENMEQIRLFRLPVLSFFPWRLWGGQSVGSWISAPILIFCRYDFFPELLLLEKRCSLRLVSATLKGKEKSLFWRCYGPLIYRRFDKIVAIGQREVASFKRLGVKETSIRFYDFRHLRILDRLERSLATLSSIPAGQEILSWIESVPKDQRLIIGSAWPYEMKIFSSEYLPKQMIFIAPHSLSAEFVTSLELEIKKIAPDLPCYRVGRDMREGDIRNFRKQWEKNLGPVLVTHPGILVELYSYFAHALVGGGYGRSVHSLLEPFWAGCNIYCGPHIERSREADYILEVAPYSLKIVSKLEEFADVLAASEEREYNNIKQKEVRSGAEETAAWILES